MIYKEYIYDVNRVSPLGLTNNIWNFEEILSGIDFKELNKFLLEFEKELLQKEATNDGDTGLWEGVTSRYEHYNLLKQDHVEIKKLEEQIKKVVRSFLEYKKLYNEKVYILCWFNVLRKGEKLNLHRHIGIDQMHYSFISGHLSTTQNDTFTFYTDMSEKKRIEIKNELGKVTLFPTYIPHFTSENPTNDLRISIAFDIFPDKYFWNHDYINNGIIKELRLK